MERRAQGTYDSYGKDAFDDPPAGPVGVHRGGRSLMARTAPYVTVIVVAALAGLVAWSVFSGEITKVRLPWMSSSSSTSQNGQAEWSTSPVTDGKDTDADSSDDSSSSADAASSGDGSDASGTAVDGQAADGSGQDASASTPVNRATAVNVVNGAGIRGYAASQAELLRQAGYTDVVSSNLSGQAPDATVVWYLHESDLSTAQDVARVLGIGDVRQMQGLAKPVVVVLMS